MDATALVYGNKRVCGLVVVSDFDSEIAAAVEKITNMCLMKINIHCRLDFNFV